MHSSSLYKHAFLHYLKWIYFQKKALILKLSYFYRVNITLIFNDDLAF